MGYSTGEKRTSCRKEPWELSYKENNLDFQYISTFFEEPEKNQFSYRLIGRDTSWSEWHHDRKKGYTNLAEGNYIFEVKSKNIYQKIGKKAQFTFTILPPWYRTWWAKLIYGLLLLLSIWILLRINSIRLRHVNVRLEEEVKKRTIELRLEKAKTEEQNRELEQLNKTKDHIFSIIGHDLRKPAIAFRGIAKKVNFLLEQEDYVTLERLGAVIEKDAYALNRLTDNLLNWALAQKDAIAYRPAKIPLFEIVNEEFRAFETIAANKNIELSSTVPNHLKVYGDFDLLSAILRNLIDNAIKFTSSGGSVAIDALNLAKEIKITISDTGIGMDSETLKNIFQLEKNKSKRGTAGEKGTGLGLHLVQELVHLNYGKINVVSTPNNGTTFSLFLPTQELE